MICITTRTRDVIAVVDTEQLAVSIDLRQFAILLLKAKTAPQQDQIIQDFTLLNSLNEEFDLNIAEQYAQLISDRHGTLVEHHNLSETAYNENDAEYE